MFSPVYSQVLCCATYPFLNYAKLHNASTGVVKKIGKGEMAEHSIISFMTHTKEPRKGHPIKVPVQFAYLGSIR